MAAGEPTKLRFTLDWIPGSVHGPFFIALYRGYEQAPASIFVLRKSGITSPQQLAGKTLGAAANDSTFKLFPIFAKFAGFDANAVTVKTIDPALREGLLVNGEVDAIAAQMFNAMLSLKAKGIKEDQVGYFLYKDYGLDLYSNGLAASRAFLTEHGDAVRGFLRATIKGVRDMAEQPELAVAMAQRFEPLLKSDIERERLQLAMSCCILTPNVLKSGFGGVDTTRLERSIGQIVKAYDLPRTPSTEEMFDASYLPPPQDRMIK